MAINRRMDKSSAKVLIQQNVTAVKRHETGLPVWITQAWNQEATAPTPVLSPGEPWTGEPGGLQPMGSKNQLLVLLIFAMISFVSFAFISALSF